MLPDLEIGDLLIVPSMGAYTKASATSFNGFQPPVTVVDDGQSAPRKRARRVASKPRAARPRAAAGITPRQAACLHPDSRAAVWPEDWPPTDLRDDGRSARHVGVVSGLVAATCSALLRSGWQVDDMTRIRIARRSRDASSCSAADRSASARCRSCCATSTCRPSRITVMDFEDVRAEDRGLAAGRRGASSRRG